MVTTLLLLDVPPTNDDVAMHIGDWAVTTTAGAWWNAIVGAAVAVVVVDHNDDDDDDDDDARSKQLRWRQLPLLKVESNAPIVAPPAKATVKNDFDARVNADAEIMVLYLQCVNDCWFTFPRQPLGGGGRNVGR